MSAGATYRMADLFSGTGSASEPARRRGWDVERIDLLTGGDARTWEPTGHYDLIWASPPCEKFSVMNIARNWTKDGLPRNEGARLARGLVEAARLKIEEAKPTFFVIENPRAKLRTLPVMQDLPRVTVTYCQYGEERMKPTDLWGVFPPSFKPRPICRNGDPCHVRAPRGSRTGTQSDSMGLDVARIPELLALELTLAVERDAGKGRPTWRRQTLLEQGAGRAA